MVDELCIKMYFLKWNVAISLGCVLVSLESAIPNAIRAGALYFGTRKLPKAV